MAKGSKRTNNGMPKWASAKPNAPLTKLIKTAIVPLRSMVSLYVQQRLDIRGSNYL
jgi:hypothetical protein